MKPSRQRSNPFLIRHSVRLGALSLAALTTTSASAEVFNVTGGGSQQWNTTTYWTPNTVPNAVDGTANVALDLTGSLTLNLASGITLGTLTTNDTGASADSTITLQGSTLTFQATGNAAWTNTNGADAIVNSNITLASNLTISNATNTLRIGNNVANTIDLGNKKLTFSDNGAGAVAVGFASSTTAGLIVGSGSIEVNRTFSKDVQTIFRNADSTYSGGTTLNAGLTVIEANSTGAGAGVTKGALGTGTVTINKTGATDVRMRANNSGIITLGNNILLKSDVYLGSGGNTAQLTLSGDVSLDAANASIITESAISTFQTLSGSIGQASAGNGLTKLGGGGLRFSGTTANTYTGTTTVSNGQLDLAKSAGVTAIAGNLGISNASTIVTLSNNEQIANTSAVSIFTSSTFRMSGFSDTIGSLSGSSSFVENGTISTTSTLTVSGASGSSTYSGTLQNGSAGVLAFAKTGDGTQILSGTNTYTGTTAISGGKLYINGVQSTATGAVSVASSATLGGTGTVGGATTISAGGIHTSGTSVTSATPTATLGKETFTTGITYNQGSIFEWNLTGNTDTTEGSRGINYDAVNTAALATTGTEAIFRVVLNGNQNFNESFWNSDRSWSDIFTTVAVDSNWNIADIFNPDVEYYNSTGLIANGNTTGRSFTISGTTLSWSAVPEPTSALAGLLLGAGLLRRKRQRTCG